MNTTKLSRSSNPAPAPFPPARRTLRIAEVLHRVGVSRTTWWRLIKAGVAPAPVKLSPRCVGWYDDAIDAFIASRG